MSDLQMPSDVRKLSPEAAAAADSPLIEPPSVKLIVRLFVIPLAIVAVAVGVMFLVGLLAGGEPTLEEAVARLRSPGGERTGDYLVGPASKQRYLDAKTLVDKMKSGMTPAERTALSAQLIDILNHNTRDDEGEVRHFILLALGRTWQSDPSQPAAPSAATTEARQRAMMTLLDFADAASLPTRKAAVLATVYFAGSDEARLAIPKVIEKLNNPQEDIDVRIAAATVLGPLGSDDDRRVVDALHAAMNDTDPRNAELVWSSALSLAQLNQANVADTILKLLSRDELAKMEYYDRESDPKNPTFRKLSDQEQQRILINTMIGVKNLDVPAVQARLRALTESDPSPRVRAAGMELTKLGNAKSETRNPKEGS
jgi:hypothetical protein